MLISLYQWSVNNKIDYRKVKQFLQEGRFPNAVIDGTAIFLEKDTPSPAPGVKCAECGRAFPKITHTHLKSHDMSVDDYKLKYPDLPMESKEYTDALSKAAKGTSVVGRGTQKGHKQSAETIAKRIETNTGKITPQHVRDKISETHRKNRMEKLNGN